MSNPPFSITIDRDTAESLPENFGWGERVCESIRKRKEREVDVETLFLERWYQLLAPKGRLGVVLPESILDTTENKYVRLFFYRLFNIKAIVSLPYLAFQPYTSTKTSLLIAQKKTAEEVKEYDELWNSFRPEYERLHVELTSLVKTRTVGLSEYTQESKESVIQKLRKFLKDTFDERDSQLPLVEILHKYAEEIEEVDEDWWIFGEVSKAFDYKIYMAHAEEIGYKRGVRQTLPRPNELFQRGEDGKIIIDTEHPKTILDELRRTVKWS